MSKGIVAKDRTVLVGVDVHTKSHVVAVKTGGELVCGCTLSPNPEAWYSFLKRFPGCDMHVIYESGPHGYNLYDWLTEANGMNGQSVSVYIAPPAQVPQAPGRQRVKTDRRDARKLIQAFEMKSFRPVVVPDKALRVERELVRTREQMKGTARRLKNQIHGLVKFHGLGCPRDKAWSKTWERELTARAKAADSAGVLCYALKAKFKMLRRTEETLAAVDKRIGKLFQKSSRSDVAQKIQKHKGIGKTTAMVIATEVADFNAFDNSDAFASHTGLTPGERSSGEAVHRGPITKEGNRRLRWAFVECAWVWVRFDPQAAATFNRLKHTIGARRAIVAMARKLAVRTWHLAVAEEPLARAA